MANVFIRAAVAVTFVLVCSCSDDSGKMRDADRALIDVPAIGDVYAAELTHFSSASFEDQQAVYGLMKVVAVEPDKIVVITENAASDNKGVPRKEILGDMSDIAFDESERIDIVHDELVKAYESGDIFAVRR